MRKRPVFASALFVGILLAPAGSSFAQSSPRGTWERDTGSARVRVAPCGDKLCGTVVWVRDADSPTKVGMRVLFDMEAERPGNWAGKAFNPEDGQNYTGVMTLNGPDAMTLSGCMIGRLLCRAMRFRRVGG